MGHYNSEMESESEFRARIDPVNRMIAIRKELENVPMSAFKASDLPALASILGVSDNHGFHPGTDQMDLIEKRIQTWKENRKRRGRK